MEATPWPRMRGVQNIGRRTGRPATSRRRSRSSGRRASRRASATRRCSARPAPARRRRWPGSSSRSRRPALVIAHNKTLAAQLCNEFREFFPNNAVEYFVSYYDYYQPEAYVPQADLYIEKDSSQNDDIARLRLAATSALFTRRDVSSSPRSRASTASARRRSGASGDLILEVGEEHDRDLVLRKLIDSPVRAQRHGARPRPLPRQGRRRRGAAGEPGDRVPRLVLRRRGRADHALRPAHAARSTRSSTTSRSGRRPST